MNSRPATCPKCGAELAEGLCPQCLLRAGMATTPNSAGRGWTPPTPEELQAQFTQYSVLELLRHGGMGAVYKGWQNSLERHVAIKVLPPALTEEDLQFTARFRHEARTLARLSHPGIVSVHDHGETAAGLCYIVMEFIEGTDVQQMITKNGRLLPEHALAIAIHVCDALAYAHENGIIHRDIKPSNVMVDPQGRVKVTDFGLAKGTLAGATLLTGTNVAMGTPGYIAPESLVMGMSVDERADLYAVGVMLYAMLTGTVPQGRFDAASVRVSGLDPRFDDVVNRAMQSEREARYATAAELRADLAAIATVPGNKGSAEMRKELAESGRPRKKAPVLLIGLAAATVCALGLFVWKPWAGHGGVPAAGAQKAPRAAQGGGAKPSGTTAGAPAGKPVAPPQVSAHPTTASPKVALPVESSDQGNEAQSSAAEPNTPEPDQSLVTPAPTEEPKRKEPAPQPTPGPIPRSGDAPVASDSSSSASTVLTSTHLAAGASSLLAAVAPAPIPAPAPAPVKPALPAELAALDEQFNKLQAERVTAPYEAELAKLKTSYSGGLDREMTKAKGAGHLDGILALEAEKKLISEKQPVPSLEDETSSNKKTPEALKNLRAIYREAYAKLEATRAANLRLLTDPLGVRLASLETEFTKKDRIADAKMVREYRESLVEALGETSGGGGLQSVAASQLQKGPPPSTAIAPARISAALKDGFTNTLGMKFARVTGTKVLFCIHTTRRKDYAVYAAEVPGVNPGWKSPARDGIPIGDGDDHPVINVSWDEAQAFCGWLGKKEGRTYRLPTDREWSMAVGIGQMEKVTKDTTPESLHRKFPDVYPWGTQWPPPKGAGNYADTSCKEKFPADEIIAGYTDGFAMTSPVMSFKPNKFGLYDMGGNVWQLCEDWYNLTRSERVARGGSWNHHDRSVLLSSHRRHHTDSGRAYSTGFRVVVVAEAGPAQQPPTPPPTAEAPKTQPISPTVGASAVNDGFTNTLGMKFARVTGTKVLFCIHTTRRKDYAVYAAEVPGVNPGWKSPARDGIPIGDGDDHPVVHVSWDEAQAFCEWLGKKEGRTYRLPTDREWSMAVGIGQMEKVTKDTTPESLRRKIPDVYPWGTQWPPPKGAGNYADTSCKEKFPADEIIAGYTDGFPMTSPVMSFKPNKIGLYDMGGNVWQWCEDWYNLTKSERVARGGSWNHYDRSVLLSSHRHHTDSVRAYSTGFRVVVVAEAGPAQPPPPPPPAAEAPKTQPSRPPGAPAQE